MREKSFKSGSVHGLVILLLYTHKGTRYFRAESSSYCVITNPSLDDAAIWFMSPVRFSALVPERNSCRKYVGRNMESLFEKGFRVKIAPCMLAGPKDTTTSRRRLAGGSNSLLRRGEMHRSIYILPVFWEQPRSRILERPTRNPS